LLLFTFSLCYFSARGTHLYGGASPVPSVVAYSPPNLPNKMEGDWGVGFGVWWEVFDSVCFVIVGGGFFFIGFIYFVWLFITFSEKVELFNGVKSKMKKRIT
jgi:hypothetical protein